MNQDNDNKLPDDVPELNDNEESRDGEVKVITLHNNGISLHKVLIVINVAVFVAMVIKTQQFLDFSTDNLIYFGAQYNYPIVVHKEYWRFFTAFFLHGGLLHLFFNMYSLFVLSKDIELLYGKVKYLLIYFGSGLFSIIVSFAFSNAVSVGASGAIFGLIGANLALYFKNKDVYKKIYGTDFVSIALVNIIYGAVIPNIDQFAHIGGLVAGFIIGYGFNLVFMKENFLKVAASWILIISCSIFIFTYKNNNYLVSADYYYNRFFELYDQREYDDALAVILEGYDKHPNDKSILYIINQIKK